MLTSAFTTSARRPASRSGCRRPSVIHCAAPCACCSRRSSSCRSRSAPSVRLSSRTTSRRMAVTRPRWLASSLARKVSVIAGRAYRLPLSRWARRPRLRLLEAVAEAVDRLDGLAVHAEALAQPPHVRVDRARARLPRDAPHLLEELPAREDAPRVLEQHLDQLELERPELQLRLVDEDPVAHRIQLEAAPLELAVAARRGARGAPLRRPPRERAHAHHELAHAEGLHDVVVGAHLEAEHAVVLVATRREHQHRDVAQ